MGVDWFDSDVGVRRSMKEGIKWSEKILVEDG